MTDVNLYVEIPEELKKELLREKVDRNITIKEIVVEALEDHLIKKRAE